MYVYNDSKDEKIETFRPRKIDKSLYSEVSNQIKNMHQYYLENEVPLLDNAQNMITLS